MRYFCTYLGLSLQSSPQCHKFNLFLGTVIAAKESTMLEFLPAEILEGLNAARKRDFTRKSRLRVQVGEAVFPVIRYWGEGFALDAGLTPHLRGLVDLYDGSRHLCQCLIVASSVENGDLVCEFKRSTMVTDRVPLDYWRDENAPVGYLPKA
jgi:hypothetical protein